MRDATEAFESLSALLGDGCWFFSAAGENNSGQATNDTPSLFDASVFAYTHLILDSTEAGSVGIMGWNDNPLKGILERHESLVKHRNMIMRMYY